MFYLSNRNVQRPGDILFVYLNVQTYSRREESRFVNFLNTLSFQRKYFDEFLLTLLLNSIGIFQIFSEDSMSYTYIQMIEPDAFFYLMLHT